MYDVTVSLDGEVFARDVLAVDIYPDVSVTALAPKVLDTLRAAGDQVRTTHASLLVPAPAVMLAHGPPRPRPVSSQAFGSAPMQVVVTTKGLKQPPADGVVDVRLLLTVLPDTPMAMKKSVAVAHAQTGRAVSRPLEVVVRGRVVDAAAARLLDGSAGPASPAPQGLGAASVASARCPPPHSAYLVLAGGRSSHPLPRPPASVLSTALSGKSNPDTARSAADANLCYVAVDVDEALRSAAASAGPDGGLITLRAQVRPLPLACPSLAPSAAPRTLGPLSPSSLTLSSSSWPIQVTLNGVDYSPISTSDNNTVTVCHAFRALSLAPSSCLCPADPSAPMNDVKVVGKSFFVTSEVPTSMFVQAVVTARVTVQVPIRGEDEDEDEDPADDCEMAAVEEEARVVRQRSPRPPPL